MNKSLLSSWPLTAASVLSLVVLGALPLAGADAPPSEAQQRAKQLEQKAKELKAQGQQERALQLVRQAEELRLQAEDRDAPERPPRGEAFRVQALTHKLDAARAELMELKRAGKDEAALKQKREVQELEAELARLQRPPRPGEPPEWAHPGEMGQPPMPPPPELQARLEHLQVAIDNLHAAGMHELADRLTQQAELLRRQLEASQPRPPAPPANLELRHLQAEVADLRQALDDLRARVGRLAEERR